MPLTEFLWNILQDSVMEEYTDGVQTAEYTSKPTGFGSLVSCAAVGTTSFSHFDALGSARLATNAAGTLDNECLFDANGNVVAGVPPLAYGWIGRYGYRSGDQGGAFYVRARTYSPSTARWHSVDPFGIIGAYIYSNNQPIAMRDPSGLFTGGAAPFTWNYALPSSACAFPGYDTNTVTRNSSHSVGFTLDTPQERRWALERKIWAVQLVEYQYIAILGSCDNLTCSGSNNEDCIPGKYLLRGRFIETIRAGGSDGQALNFDWQAAERLKALCTVNPCCDVSVFYTCTKTIALARLDDPGNLEDDEGHGCYWNVGNDASPVYLTEYTCPGETTPKPDPKPPTKLNQMPPNKCKAPRPQWPVRPLFISDELTSSRTGIMTRSRCGSFYSVYGYFSGYSRSRQKVKLLDFDL